MPWLPLFQPRPSSPPPPPPPPGGPVTVISHHAAIPDDLPLEVVQAIARCACCKGSHPGSGSGSGGGGGDVFYCCGCQEGFSFPLTLTASYNMNCGLVGTMTLNRKRNGCIMGYDALFAGCATDKIAAAYYGIWQGPIDEDTYFSTDCHTNVTLATLENRQSVVIKAYCLTSHPSDSPHETGYTWVIYSRFFRLNGAVHKAGDAEWRKEVKVSSCNPFILPEISGNVVCYFDALGTDYHCGNPSIPWPSGDISGCLVDRCNVAPLTRGKLLLGCNVKINISE